MYKTIVGSIIRSSGKNEKIQVHSVDWKDFPKFAGFEPTYLYGIVRAISSRSNANHDGWLSRELKEAHQSFVGKGIYVEHQNWDPKTSRGVILDAIYKESKLKSGLTDGAIYLLLEIDAQEFPKLASAILTGKIKAVSMGANVAFTICSACGNKAETPDEYCNCIRFNKGQTIPIHNAKTGSTHYAYVYELCREPDFFEISNVFDPADESGWYLKHYYCA